MSTSTRSSDRELLRWMFAFLRPVKLRVFLSCLYLTLWVGAETLAVRQTAEVVNQIQRVAHSGATATAGFWSWITGPSTEARQIRRIGLILVGLGAAVGALSYLREVSNGKLSMHMVFHVREAVYDKLQRAGFAFHDRMSTGELINRSLTDLQNVRQFVNSSVLTTLEIALIVTAYLLLLLSRSPWVAALALAPLPIWSWYILRFSKKVQPAQRAVMEAGDRNVSLITEAIAGVHVIKAFATQKHAVREYDRNCDSFFDRVMTRIGLFANFQPVIRLIASVSHLSLFLAGGLLIWKGRLLPGDLLMLGAAMGAILGRLQQVSVINEQYQSAIVSSRRLREVLEAAPFVGEANRPMALPPGDGSVRFEDVSFSYDGERNVLDRISFDVRGQSTVAVVGPVGAGKSTLVSLIARFHDPTKGRVLIDGVDVRDVALESLRTQVGVVFQETYLFSESVGANIAYSQPDMHAHAIEEMAKLTQAHEFITELPRGYETPLGDRGMTLSGGQRQRLAIARALLSNPRILILDDATAAIDPETENLVHRGLESTGQGRTTFVIAHRISTVRRADLVIVLQQGRITQMGRHDELLRQPGYYRDIALAQLDQDDVESLSDPVRLPADEQPYGASHG